MILYSPRNKFYLDENNIFSDWQKGNISKVGLELSIQLQYIADLNF